MTQDQSLEAIWREREAILSRMRAAPEQVARDYANRISEIDTRLMSERSQTAGDVRAKLLLAQEMLADDVGDIETARNLIADIIEDCEPRAIFGPAPQNNR